MWKIALKKIYLLHSWILCPKCLSLVLLASGLSSSHEIICQVLVLEIHKAFTTNVPNHIETSQLIYIANQLTGFYMMGNIGR